VISQLRVLMRSESTGDKFDRELWTAELNPLLALWKKLNQVSIKFVYIIILIF
jgi:dynein heavy chain 2